MVHLNELITTLNKRNLNTSCHGCEIIYFINVSFYVLTTKVPQIYYFVYYVVLKVQGSVIVFSEKSILNRIFNLRVYDPDEYQK